MQQSMILAKNNTDDYKSTRESERYSNQVKAETIQDAPAPPDAQAEFNAPKCIYFLRQNRIHEVER